MLLLSCIVCLRTGILYYLQHEEEAAKIADHAYKAASQKATWEIRAKELLDIMEVKEIF